MTHRGTAATPTFPLTRHCTSSMILFAIIVGLLTYITTKGPETMRTMGKTAVSKEGR